MQEIKHLDREWTHLSSPTAEAVEELRTRYGFSELEAEDILSRRQRPKLDRSQDYVFLVLHFPRFDEKENALATVELDVFWTPNYIITLPNRQMPQLERIQNDMAQDPSVLERGTGYVLYLILDSLMDTCWPHLDRMDSSLDQIEDDIFKRGGRGMIREISSLRHDLITYRKIIKPERLTFRQLEAHMRNENTELEGYYDDLVDSVERVWDLLEHYTELADSLEATNESVVQRRLNDILLVLTFINVLILPLNLITGIYGMNIPLPGQKSHWSLLVITLVMILTIVVLTKIFLARKNRL